MRPYSGYVVTKSELLRLAGGAGFEPATVGFHDKPQFFVPYGRCCELRTFLLDFSSPLLYLNRS